MVVWQEILALKPDDDDVEKRLQAFYVTQSDWDGLETLLGTRQRWNELVDVYATSVARMTDVIEICSVYERMADVCANELGDEAGAIECYERIFEADKHNLRASDRLVENYREHARWSELATVLEARVESNTNSIAERLELAQTYRDHLDEPSSAYDWFVSVLELEPNREDVLRHILETAIASGKEDTLYSFVSAQLDTSLEVETSYLRLSIT